jgi:hypothetical protein
MTPDVKRLHCVLAKLHDVLDEIKFELVDDPQWPEPSDTSYLNDDDRANPDIMANVEAMTETNSLIAWFGRDLQGFIGLWRGPVSLPLELAPVVRLDSEGQYSLLATTVPGYIAASVDDESFDDTRAALIAAGFDVLASRKEIWAALDGIIDPNAFRHELYNQGRARRGLVPV